MRLKIAEMKGDHQVKLDATGSLAMQLGGIISSITSPANKTQNVGSMVNGDSNAGFLERMEQQQSQSIENDPMQHTFSSLSPTRQHSSKPVSKGNTEYDDKAFINPFSIAAREMDGNEKEFTAEGFFKNPDENPSALNHTSTFLMKDQDLEEQAAETKLIYEKRVSPFDVLQQHQMEAQNAKKNFSRNPAQKEDTKKSFKLTVVQANESIENAAQVTNG